MKISAFSFWHTMAFFLILLVFPSLAASGAEQPIPVPFTFGENLVYEVRFLGVHSGTASLSILEKRMVNGRPVYPILSTTKSNRFLSMVYSVNNRIESMLDVEGLYSHSLDVDQHEGGRTRQKRLDFDQEAHKVVQTKKGQRDIFDIPPKVNDFLSALYYFRTKPLIVGRSVFVDVHESEKNWSLEIRVLGKETVTTPLGTFNTLKLQAMPRYEGIFLSKGDLFIWITDDDKKIPVIMQSKIKVGSIKVSLISK